jgi:hypothetical protein
VILSMSAFLLHLPHSLHQRLPKILQVGTSVPSQVRQGDRTLNPRIVEPPLPASGVDCHQCPLPAPMAIQTVHCRRLLVVICHRVVSRVAMILY